MSFFPYLYDIGSNIRFADFIDLTILHLTHLSFFSLSSILFAKRDYIFNIFYKSAFISALNFGRRYRPLATVQITKSNETSRLMKRNEKKNVPQAHKGNILSYFLQKLTNLVFFRWRKLYMWSDGGETYYARNYQQPASLASNVSDEKNSCKFFPFQRERTSVRVSRQGNNGELRARLAARASAEPHENCFCLFA